MVLAITGVWVRVVGRRAVIVSQWHAINTKAPQTTARNLLQQTLLLINIIEPDMINKSYNILTINGNIYSIVTITTVQ